MATPKRKTVVMSWSEVLVLFGLTGANDAFATELYTLGIINDKSTSLSFSEGDTLTATATGGKVVAEEYSDGTIEVTTRVKEMDFDTEHLLTGSTVDTATGNLVVTTHIVEKEMSLKVVPKNVGAIGIKARRCKVKFVPGYSEEEGNFVDVTFKILECEDGELYQKFRVKAEDKTGYKVPGDTTAG
ncbi:MAG: hypothetical protein NC044_05415 [Prevotella sp.]|nr:hypothetical protein [Lachnospiraceae bacterium]MCM1379572.1 hypothetical protein [Bacteroides sp.]MCM1445826.1 hypothetical protein [Prevotella sp.]